MRNKRLIKLLLCSLVASSPAWAATKIHVTSDGTEKGNGSIEKPFANLDQARNKVRHLPSSKKSQGVEVIVHQGKYLVNKTIQFWKADSGLEKFPITYKNAKGENPVFFGGTILPADKFLSLTDAHFINNLVDKNAANHIKVINLKQLGITDYGEITRHGWNIHNSSERVAPVSLQVAGKRMTLARWPNVDEDSEFMTYQHYLPKNRPLRGYEKKVQAIIDNAHLPGDVTFTHVVDEGDSASQKPKGKGGTFAVAFDRMKYWQDIENIFVDGVFASTWEWSYNRLAKVNIDKREITLAEPEINGVGIGESVRLPHFHFDNIPEEIDQAGEYYIDRVKGLLYLYPPENFQALDIVLTTLKGPMIAIENAQNIVFDGLSFTSGRDIAFKINRSHKIHIKNATIANFTKGGIAINGNNNVVYNTHLYGIGAYGVHLNGGNKQTLSPANNLVLNCHIHDFGWDQKSQQPGVLIDGVGQYVSHSKIHDGTHFAIRVRNANDVVIERNEIFDLPKYHHFDGGALYVFSGYNAQNRGVEIRQNYFHDIPTIGVYPDNYTWGVHTYENIFNNVGVKASRAAVFVNAGGDNRTYNNIFIDTVLPYGQGIQPKAERWMTHWKKTQLRFGHGKVNNTPYAKYPDFIRWLEKKTVDELYRGKSYVNNNLIYNSPKVQLLPKAIKNGTVDHTKSLQVENQWLTNTNPGFVDIDKGNFNLKKNAEVFQHIPNFIQPEFDDMGLIKR